MATPPIDPSRLAALPILEDEAVAALRDPELGGDPEFLTEVVEAFLGDSPHRLAALRASIARGDAEALTRAAHSLKGSSGNFGAARVQILCAEVERLGRSGAIETARPLVELLEGAYAQLADRLVMLVAAARSAPTAAP